MLYVTIPFMILMMYVGQRGSPEKHEKDIGRTMCLA